MKTIRKIITPLLVVPVSLLVLNVLFSYKWGEELEYLYLVFGAPVLVFNYWAWFSPIIIERFFFLKE
jgi:hypothetical protein